MRAFVAVVSEAISLREALSLSGATPSPWSRLWHALHAAAVGTLSSLAIGFWSTGPSSYTLNIVGNVPTICTANFSATAVDAGEGLFDLGTFAEFCNSSTGFQVWLETAPGLTGTVIVDNRRIPLSQSGATLIEASDRAARKSVRVFLDMPEGRIEKVSVRILPL